MKKTVKQAKNVGNPEIRSSGATPLHRKFRVTESGMKTKTRLKFPVKKKVVNVTTMRA
jgi:hypothetical protein